MLSPGCAAWLDPQRPEQFKQLELAIHKSSSIIVSRTFPIALYPYSFPAAPEGYFCCCSSKSAVLSQESGLYAESWGIGLSASQRHRREDHPHALAE